MKEAKKHTIKCSEEKCNEYYYARDLCRKHYKRLLGREGGYAKEYQKNKNNPAYKAMKAESDKKYKQRLREEGVLSEYMHERYEAAKSNPLFMAKRRELNKAYYKKSKELVLAKGAAHGRKLRDEYKLIVMNHYSNNDPKCANCGIDALSVLCIDHIYNDGADHKRKLNKNGKKQIGNTDLLRDIIKNNFPPRYQVLCFNCNYHKEFLRKCDLYEKKMAEALSPE